MNSHSLIGLALWGVGALAILAALSRLARRGPLGAMPVRQRPMMTRIEREVLAHLERAVPFCRVHAQVSLGALLAPQAGLSRSQATSVRNRFSSKRADYVLEHRQTGAIVALVELDDRSHVRAADQARDRMTARAGYLTIRLAASRYPTRHGVAAQVRDALSQQFHQQQSSGGRR